MLTALPRASTRTRSIMRGTRRTSISAIPATGRRHQGVTPGIRAFELHRDASRTGPFLHMNTAAKHCVTKRSIS